MNSLSAVTGRTVSRETTAKLESYLELLKHANQGQNLIAKSSLNEAWERHVLDSAQLVRHFPTSGSLADIGSGAGLPGVVLAALTRAPTVLVEPRALRAAFLGDVIERLALDRAEVFHGKAAALNGKFDIVTARAVASASQLFAMTLHLAHAGTVFVFPKGRSASSELEVVSQTWQGDFRLEPSLTSDDASILVATRVTPRGKG